MHFLVSLQLTRAPRSKEPQPEAPKPRWCARRSRARATSHRANGKTLRRNLRAEEIQGNPAAARRSARYERPPLTARALGAVACSPGVVPPRCARRSALSTVEHGSPPRSRYGVPHEFHAHCATVPRELPQTAAHLARAPCSAEPQFHGNTDFLRTRDCKGAAESAENRGVASNSKVSVCRLSLSVARCFFPG